MNDITTDNILEHSLEHSLEDIGTHRFDQNGPQQFMADQIQNYN